jgi:hypothetical protein
MTAGRALAAAAAVVLVAALGARAADLGTLVTSYESARRAGKVGTVRILAVAGPAQRLGPDRPLDGVTVTLVPWSPDLEARLESIKAGSRDSIDRFVRASEEVQAARRSWEGDLLAAGGGGLVLLGDTDASGHTRFPSVPAGEWLLIAGRGEARADAKTVKPFVKDGGGFVGNPASLAHVAVSFWKRQVTVGAGDEVDVRLTDRGVWLTAVETERRPAVDPPIGAHPRSPR